MGVSESAKADIRVKPAPPVEPSSYSEDETDTETQGPHFNIPSVLKDKISITAEEINEPNLAHDEL